MRCWLSLILFISLLSANRSGAATVTKEWSKDDVVLSRRSHTIGPVKNGGLALVDRDLVQYETGATVHPQAAVSAEQVGGLVVIKKEFVLESTFASTAELCVLADDRLDVYLNGTALPAYERQHTRARPYDGVYPTNKFAKGHAMYRLNGQPYQEFWKGGWERVPFEPGLLKKGVNTFVIAAAEGRTSRFLIEPSLFPNHSAVSRDGGQTWDYDRLSKGQNINGEYVVRLALGRYPLSGWLESEPVDVWPGLKGTPVGVPSRIGKIRLRVDADSPWGTDMQARVRAGTTPLYSPESWTAWKDASDLQNMLGDKPYRFLQWRVELKASSSRKKSPHVRGVTLEADVTPTRVAPKDGITECRVEQPSMVRSSVPFVHATHSERLKLLRADAELDKVVEGKARGIEQLLALAKWVKETFGKNAGGRLLVDTNWDALMIWHNARGKDRLTGQMCTNRGAMFTQCATALGYVARPCIWSHAIAEVWLDDVGGWVAIDPSDAMYFEVNGKPASMLAASRAWEGTAEGTPKMAVRRVWGPKNKSKPQGNKSVAWHTRFWIPMRSNYLDSPEPFEQGHGKTTFKYDGYLRWEHPLRKTLPWFSNYTSREGDIDFTVNTVNMCLAMSESENSVDVVLDTDTPNLAHFETRKNLGDWQDSQGSFTWKLARGINVLEARAVNSFGMAGRISRVRAVIQK